MEELKILVELIASLPTMALWVLCGYLIYKLAVVGSIYGVIRFAIDKAHAAYTYKKRIADEVFILNPKEIACVNPDVESAIMKQLRRIRSTNYIHLSDVEKLAAALDKAGIP